MNIVQITPGAGGMYCGNCFRDNALVAALRRQGHETLMVPLYLPMTLEDEDNTDGTPIFYGGINVYLEQKSAWFRNMPQWLHHWLATKPVLKWAAGRAAKTRAADVGELTLSMMQGEEGHQARELQELIDWLKTREQPDVICLSNALLIGLVRKLKKDLRSPVVCMLQGEDSFLDALNNPPRDAVWQTLLERAREVDLFISPSRYYADLMSRRLKLGPGRVEVVPNGINLEGFTPHHQAGPLSSGSPVLGYFARMCPEKGLDTLVQAFMLLKKRNQIPGLKLKIGGGCGPGDRAFVNGLKDQLQAGNYLPNVEFHPNLDRAGKQRFLQSLTVMSVPALYGEAFGLYLLEAWASGVPVVQPRHAAFPELIEQTGAGLLCEPDGPVALAEAIEQLLMDKVRWRQASQAGRQAVEEHFNVDQMARRVVKVYQKLGETTGGEKPGTEETGRPKVEDAVDQS